MLGYIVDLDARRICISVVVNPPRDFCMRRACLAGSNVVFLADGDHREKRTWDAAYSSKNKLVISLAMALQNEGERLLHSRMILVKPSLGEQLGHG